MRTRDGGSLSRFGSWKDGRKMSKAFMAEEARCFVQRADSWLGLCM